MNQINFAYKIRHALNENLENLPSPVTNRLATARQTAIVKKKQTSPRLLARQNILAGQAGRWFNNHLAWLMRIGVAAPLLAGVALLPTLYQYEQQNRIAAAADIDVAVLSDELPPSAYLDRGFNAYLTEKQNQ